MAKKSSFQIWAEYAAARLVLGTLGLLPRRAAMWSGVTIGKLAYNALGKLRRVGLRNLELAFPDMDPSERERILKAALGNLGRLMAVVSRFGEITRENITDLIEYR